MKKMVMMGVLLLLFLLLSVQPATAEAGSLSVQPVDDTVDSRDIMEDSLLKDTDFTEVDALLEETLDEECSFRDMVQKLMSGKVPWNQETVQKLLEGMFLTEIKANARTMVYILLIAVLSAALTNFTRVFDRNQTADIGFYIVYLLLLTVLVSSFQSVNAVAETVLGQMTEFMKLLMPTYMITIAAAKGATTATVFYEFLIILIYAVNFVLFKVLLPLCNVYVVLNLVNYISKEDMLSKTAALMKTIISWGLKTLMAVVVGLNIVQGIITPALDTFKTTTLHKAIQAIPGVGGTMNAVTEMVVGSGILIKNGVGVGMLIFLVLISLVPVCKMTVFMLLYRVTAAAIQPISDKRMTDCVHTISEGARLLLKCVTTAMVLFFITIAILTVSTSV